MDARMARKPADDDGRSQAEKHRERMKQQSRRNYADASDIGPIPEVVNPERRERCRLSLYEDLVTYYPNSTGLKPFSSAHRKVIDRMQWSVLEGQDVWNCVFRGFAKTSIAIGTASWALRNGHRKFIPMLAANKKFAVNLLRMLKSGLQTNEFLLEDFPEVCYPIRALEGKNQRCASQTSEGKPTLIVWSNDEIMLPTIEGSKASGGICLASGIMGALNGLVRTLNDGRNVRPDWWLADDLQTRATARSATQIENRLDALQHSVMMLGGHQETIGGCVNGTLFKPDDVMQQLANPELFPSFSGEIVPMVIQWPDAHETFWLDEYAKVLRAFDPKKPNDRKRAFQEASSLYASRRAEADAGAEVTWEHCYKEKHGELSALQHAYNILILQGDEVFATECQQNVYLDAGETEQLCLTDINLKLSGYKRGYVPPECVKLTAFVDVQESSLWWGVIAWTDAFGGFVIDYGAWPDQGTTDVHRNNVRKSIAQKYRNLGSKQARLRAAIADLSDELLSRQWSGDDGRTLEIVVMGIDVGDGDAAKPLRSWAIDKENKWRSRIQPCMGIAVRPQDEPINERKKGKTEVARGLNWYCLRDPEFKGGTIQYTNVNWWKSFVAARWRSASPRSKNDPGWRPNDGGSLYLWGTDPQVHTTFATMFLAERCERITNESKGRSCDVWTIKNKSLPNEFLDILVGAAALASRQGGIELRDAGLSTALTKKRKKLTAAELRAIREAKQNG
jgi:Phage terminase large subunit (GpA)